MSTERLGAPGWIAAGMTRGHRYEAISSPVCACLAPAIRRISSDHLQLGASRDEMESGRRVWGVSFMRITIDTREDSYEDALGVLRRAYGRHVLVRKKEESSGPSVRVESNKRGAAKKSSRESTTGRSGREARKHPANGRRKSVSGKASATSGVVADSPTLSTARKAPGKTSRRPAGPLRLRWSRPAVQPVKSPSRASKPRAAGSSGVPGNWR